MPIETDLLPDHVWQQLDPRAGQLSPMARRRARRNVVVVALVGAVLLATWLSGAILPRVNSGDQSYGSGADSLKRTISVRVDVRNSGWTDARLISVGRDGPGLRLMSVDTSFPSDLRQATGQIVTLTYKVTDCAAVPRDDWPIPVRVARPWGETTSWFHLRPAYPLSGRDTRAMEWQGALAATACAPISAGLDTPTNAG